MPPLGPPWPRFRVGPPGTFDPSCAAGYVGPMFTRSYGTQHLRLARAWVQAELAVRGQRINTACAALMFCAGLAGCSSPTGPTATPLGLFAAVTANGRPLPAMVDSQNRQGHIREEVIVAWTVDILSDTTATLHYDFREDFLEVGQPAKSLNEWGNTYAIRIVNIGGGRVVVRSEYSLESLCGGGGVALLDQVDTLQIVSPSVLGLRRQPASCWPVVTLAFHRQ